MLSDPFGSPISQACTPPLTQVQWRRTRTRGFLALRLMFRGEPSVRNGGFSRLRAVLFFVQNL
jgi:hypothetical protein